MSRRNLDTSDLPEEAWESLRDYYEFLRQRYVGDDEPAAFDPTKYRGAVDVGLNETEKRLDSLRDEWQ
jgi:hypothetical protein